MVRRNRGEAAYAVLTPFSDECRRKKIKCDGKQPCTHCTVYSYGEHAQPLQTVARTVFLTLHPQSVLMINPRTGGAPPRLNTSRHWKPS